LQQTLLARVHNGDGVSDDGLAGVVLDVVAEGGSKQKKKEELARTGGIDGVPRRRQSC
jgi:hypothetical protein